MTSHLSAGAELRLVRAAPMVVDVTSPRALRSRPSIRIHTRSLDPDDLRTLAGLPITSPSQTLFDLAAVLDDDALAKAANEAFFRQLCTVGELRGALARNDRRKGAAPFRRLLALIDPEGHRVRSPLEVRLHAFLRARGFRSDGRRDRRLRVEGWQPVRVTSTDLGRRPDELESDLRALLAAQPRQ